MPKEIKVEPVEITIVVPDTKLLELLNLLREQVKKGGDQVLVEYGDINFQVYTHDSVKLMEYDAKRK